jgi:hypothetical protein
MGSAAGPGPGSTPGPERYDWPEDVPRTPPGPGMVTLVILYTAPIVLLLVFPTIAWIALLPLSFLVRRTSHPAHQRPASWLYLGTGLISVIPWIGMLLR